MKSSPASRAAHAACAALIAVATVPRTVAAQSPSPPPAADAAPAQAQPKLSEVKPMSEDKRVKAEDIDSVMQDGKVFFLDVREPKELEEFGTYEGYVNIPMSQLESRLGELPKDRPILTA
jgi:hypothetical protein